MSDVTKILHRLAIIQRDHRKICHTSYSDLHDFPRPRPDSMSFQPGKCDFYILGLSRIRTNPVTPNKNYGHGEKTHQPSKEPIIHGY